MRFIAEFKIEDKSIEELYGVGLDIEHICSKVGLSATLESLKDGVAIMEFYVGLNDVCKISTADELKGLISKVLGDGIRINKIVNK